MYPFYNAIILLLLMIVNLWWAIKIDNLPSYNLSIFLCIINSFFMSKADVASSNKIIYGFFNIILAIAILCFCPPESWLPWDPTL